MKLSTLLAITTASVLSYAQTDYRYLRIPKKVLTEKFIQESGFIEDHYHDDAYIIGYLPHKRDYKIPTQIAENILELDAKAWAHTEYDIKTLKALPIDTSRISQEYEAFHTYDTLTTELKLLAEKYPTLVTLSTAGKTVRGREMWYLRITAKDVLTTAKPKLLYISSMHGDEVTGKEMMVYLIRDLLSKYGTDERITRLVNHNELFIMPSMNPDGTEMSQRFNADGVDLNRDFPELNEDPFGGNRAIETKNIMELHRQNHFDVALNFHGGSLCVNIPWDSKKNNSSALFGDNALMLSIAHQYANNNVPMKGNNAGNFNQGVTYGYEWYPIYGGMQDWASYFRESTHATVEISSTKWPSANALAGFWNDNRESLLKYLENGSTGVHLKVTNAQGELLDVAVQLSSSSRAIHYTGYVHRPSVSDTQQVTVSSTGYVSKTVNVTPHQFIGGYDSVVLEKN